MTLPPGKSRLMIVPADAVIQRRRRLLVRIWRKGWVGGLLKGVEKVAGTTRDPEPIGKAGVRERSVEWLRD